MFVVMAWCHCTINALVGLGLADYPALSVELGNQLHWGLMAWFVCLSLLHCCIGGIGRIPDLASAALLPTTLPVCDKLENVFFLYFCILLYLCIFLCASLPKY